MPIYEYQCSNTKCKHNFEIYQSIKDDKLVVCPQCNKETLYRIIFAPMMVSVGEVKTLGSLAEKNTRNMSDEQRENLRKKHETKKVAGKRLPEGMSRQKVNVKKNIQHQRKMQKILSKGDVAVNKYIMTGKE